MSSLCAQKIFFLLIDINKYIGDISCRSFLAKCRHAAVLIADDFGAGIHTTPKIEMDEWIETGLLDLAKIEYGSMRRKTMSSAEILEYLVSLEKEIGEYSKEGNDSLKKLFGKDIRYWKNQFKEN